MKAVASPKISSAPRHGLAALIVANICLALGPMLVRLADTGPIASAFWRMAIALPFIAMLAALTGRSSGRFTPALIGIITASGLFFAADLASWHMGIVRTKAANATLFGNSASLLFPIYGFVVARSWPTRRQWVSLAIALIGAAILMGQSAELSSRYVAGDLLSFLAGVFYAAYFIAIARARATLSPMPLLAASTAASIVPLLVMAWLMGEQVLPGNWTPLVMLAIGSQVIGQGLMVYALGGMTPLVIGLTLMTQPVVAALTGWIMFDERLGTVDFIGAALVGLALVLVRQPEPKAESKV
jgi:drug/metabolite transporter (DMT)-like permease